MLEKSPGYLKSAVVTGFMLATLAITPALAQTSSSNNGNSGQNDNSTAQTGQAGSQQTTPPGNNQANPSGPGAGSAQNPCIGQARNTSTNAGQMNNSAMQGSTQNNSQTPNQANANNNAGNQQGNNQGSQTSGQNNQNMQMAGPGMAQDPCGQFTFGTSRETAGGPFGGWVQIAPQTTTWYKFKYYYSPRNDDSDDEDNNGDNDDNEPTNAVVHLRMNVPNCVSFEIQTPERLDHPDRYAEGNKDDDDAQTPLRGPVGRGTPFATNNHDDDSDEMVRDPSHLVWVGSAAATDTYYVIVRNRTNAACTYTLSITGPDVAF